MFWLLKPGLDRHKREGLTPPHEIFKMLHPGLLATGFRRWSRVPTSHLSFILNDTVALNPALFFHRPVS